MSLSDPTRGITIFDGQRANWSTYKEELVALLVSHDKYEECFDLIFPEEDGKDHQSIASSSLEHKRSGARPPKPSRTLYGILYKTCHENAYKWFNQAPVGDGLHCWMGLKAEFEKDSAFEQRKLLASLMHFPWNPKGNTEYSISDYIMEFQKHTSLINRTCKSVFPTGVHDMLLLTCFLSSLRQQVKFKMILELLDLQKDLTLEVAMTALKSRSEYDTEPEPPSAFYNHSNKFDRNTNGRFDRNTNGRTRREGKSTSEGCFICGDYGHMKHHTGNLDVKKITSIVYKEYSSKYIEYSVLNTTLYGDDRVLFSTL